jgi:competence protein ComK
MIENFEITTITYALIPINDSQTEIITESETIKLDISLKKILNYSCEYYGSSFEGRLKGSQNILGMRYKLPIVIEENKEIVMFPLGSYLNNNCIWLSLNNIKHYEKYNNQTQIIFNNGFIKTFDISFESLENQVLRATKLLSILQKRKKS